MAQPSADRNLLFGVLALQMDFIKREQLIAAMQAWVFDKGKAIGEILCSQKALAEDNRALLEALVQKHLAQHGNDAEKSLAAVSAVTEVRKDLEKLADVDIQASLIHVSPARAGNADIYATVAPGSIGESTSNGMRFRILRPHAKGGLGEVWVARDEELHREVALKEIQERQADNLDSRSRFMLEAEITGGLEHPGIVPVYGLGTYADGRPYYAMRFIRGDSLKEAVDRFHKADKAGMSPGQRTLELRGLLGRLVDVCNAIAYAHSRGVLHRDLKPGNIMLGKYGETLVVDWGLAKPLGEPARGSESTEPGEGSLMPSSMSSASQTLVGSAVGTPQYMSPEQAGGKLDQLGPASDVYSLGATLYCILTGQASVTDTDVGAVLHKVQRGDFARPREIKKDIPAPLEAICLKAMKLQPSERYATPRVLAEEIEHWLADEPVAAWPEPFTVRARRWIGRHGALVTGVASAVAIALVSLVVATVLLTAANERERQAKAKAEENYVLARSAVDRYMTNVSEDVLLLEPGMQPLRKKLLESAREYYEKFAKERANDKSVQGELGKATFRLAQITGDIDSEPEAIKLHEQAVKLFENAPAAQTNADTQSDLAACFHHLGRLYRLTDHIEQSEASYKKALTLWEQLGKDQRVQAGLARTQLGLGNFYQFTRRLEPAQKLYQQARENWEALAAAHPKTPEYQRDLAVTLNNLGMVLAAPGGKEAEAENAFRAALAIQEKLTANAPHISQYQNDLARTNFNLGNYKEAAKTWQALVDRHAAVTNFHANQADAFSELSKLHRQDRDLKKAEEAGKQAVVIQRKLAANNQGVSSYQGAVARGLYALGDVYRADTQLGKAEEAYQEAIRIQGKLVTDLPKVPHYQRDLARSYNSLGMLHAQNKQEVKAADAFNKSVALWDRLITENSAEQEFTMGLSGTYVNLGTLTNIAKKHKDALEWFTRAQEILDAQKQRTPENARVKNALGNAHWLRAMTLAQLDRHADSLLDWNRTLELASPAQKPAIRLARMDALARSGKYAEATSEADQLVNLAESGEARYRFASVYALSAASAAAESEVKLPKAERERLSDQFAAQAVKMLAASQEAGFFKAPANLEKLTSDANLEVLRARPDFMKLASELKAK